MFDVERRKKTEDGECVFFKALAKMLLLTLKDCFLPTFYQMDFKKRWWYVPLLCYITKSRPEVQFVKKIPMEIVIDQQMKEEGYDQKLQMAFTINFPLICYLSRICKKPCYKPQVLNTHLLSQGETFISYAKVPCLSLLNSFAK